MYIRSVASYLPPRTSTQQAVDDGLYDAKDLGFMQLTGALFAGDTSPAEMATAAARTALERGGVTSQELDYLIHSNVYQPGPHAWSLPGYILRELGGGKASVLELRTGCSGMLSSVELAVAQLTGAQRYSNVLLTAAENFDPWMERWKSDVYITGDAASALLLSSTSGFARVVSAASGSSPELEKMNRGSEPLHPPGETAVVDLRVRHAVVTDTMGDREAANIMAAQYVELAERAAADGGIKLADVDKLVYHNMAGFIVGFFAEQMGLSLEHSTWEFGRTLGHLGCSDQAVGLEHLLLTGELSPGDRVMLLAASAGFATSCILLEILDVPDWPAPAPIAG
uniref:SsfG n=1 Tax=Streptomyces sp. SF2575 TaxID=746675 RepID=D6MSX1_9ACTN|nr:SsfG [Streptomyces sp. SF2575]